MFAEVKAMMANVSGDDYDEEIIMNIEACALDLTTSAEITLPGTISITRTQDQQTGKWTITDNSTITDRLIITVIATWCRVRIGNAPDKDFLLDAYNAFKGQLRLSARYKPQQESGEA